MKKLLFITSLAFGMCAGMHAVSVDELRSAHAEAQALFAAAERARSEAQSVLAADKKMLVGVAAGVTPQPTERLSADQIAAASKEQLQEMLSRIIAVDASNVDAAQKTFDTASRRVSDAHAALLAATKK